MCPGPILPWEGWSRRRAGGQEGRQEELNWVEIITLQWGLFCSLELEQECKGVAPILSPSVDRLL